MPLTQRSATTDKMSVTPVLLIGFAVGASLFDLKYRRVPNSYVVAGLAAGLGGWFGGWSHWSMTGMAVALICCILGNLRQGDLKASTVMGGFLDPLTMGITFIIGYFAAVICLVLYDRDWIVDDVRLWPFVPFISVPACGMVWLT